MLDVGKEVADECGEDELRGDGKGPGGGKDVCGSGREGGDGSTQTGKSQRKTVQCVSGFRQSRG